jgi:hypothetical protein
VTTLSSPLYSVKGTTYQWKELPRIDETAPQLPRRRRILRDGVEDIHDLEVPRMIGLCQWAKRSAPVTCISGGRRDQTKRDIVAGMISNAFHV